MSQSVPDENSNVARLCFPETLGAGGFPMEAAGDHQVQNDPKLMLKTDGDPLAQPPQCNDLLALDRLKRR